MPNAVNQLDSELYRSQVNASLIGMTAPKNSTPILYHLHALSSKTILSYILLSHIVTSCLLISYTHPAKAIIYPPPLTPDSIRFSHLCHFIDFDLCVTYIIHIIYSSLYACTWVLIRRPNLYF